MEKLSTLFVEKKFFSKLWLNIGIGTVPLLSEPTVTGHNMDNNQIYDSGVGNDNILLLNEEGIPSQHAEFSYCGWGRNADKTSSIAVTAGGRLQSIG